MDDTWDIPKDAEQNLDKISVCFPQGAPSTNIDEQIRAAATLYEDSNERKEDCDTGSVVSGDGSTVDSQIEAYTIFGRSDIVRAILTD